MLLLSFASSFDPNLSDAIKTLGEVQDAIFKVDVDGGAVAITVPGVAWKNDNFRCNRFSIWQYANQLWNVEEAEILGPLDHLSLAT